MGRIRKLGLAIITPVTILALTISLYSPALAFKEKYDYQYYSSNGILFYNPEDTSCGKATGLYSGETDISSLQDTPDNKAIFQTLISNKEHTITSVMAAAIMGNMYGESRLNPNASEEPVGPGYGLAQWSTEGRKAGLEAFAAAEGKDKSDALVQTRYLLKEYNESYYNLLTGTDFDERSNDISKATTTWMQIFENPLEQDGPDPSGLNSRRIPAAIAIYDYYKDLNPNSGTATAAVNKSNCGSGVVAGQVVQTAVGFALTEPFPNGNFVTGGGQSAKTTEAGYTASRDTWKVGKPKYNPNQGVAWTDCGGFIATVMRASQVDPDYPTVSVTAQTNYVTSHPEKYKIIRGFSAGDLKPGDILLSSGHTTMYTGAEKYPNVDASYGQRVPSVRNAGSHTWMIGQGAMIARFIGTTVANKNPEATAAGDAL